MTIINVPDDNHPYTPKTDLEQIKIMNAKWAFIFGCSGDKLNSNIKYGDHRIGFMYYSSSKDWDNPGILNTGYIYAGKELSWMNALTYLNSDCNYQVYNPYYLRYGLNKLKLPDSRYNSETGVKVVKQELKIKSGTKVSAVYSNSNWHDSNGIYHSDQRADAYNFNNITLEIDSTKNPITTASGEVSYTSLPYLKDSQIDYIFNEIKKDPTDVYLIKCKHYLCNVVESPYKKRTEYYWKAPENTLNQCPSNTKKQIYVYYDSWNGNWYDPNTEIFVVGNHVLKQSIEGDLYNDGYVHIARVEFGNVAQNWGTYNSNYEQAYAYYPDNAKVLAIPAFGSLLDIQPLLEEEIQARKDGDAELLQKINKEAQDRSTAVSNEATARTNADNSLDQKITTEKNDRIKDVDDEENARKKAIEEEAKTRKEEDDKLEDKKLNRYDKDEEVDGVKPDWDEEPTRHSHKAVNSDAVYRICKNLRLYQANIGKDKIAVAKLKPVDYPFQVTIFSKGEMATFDVHSTVMGRALTPGCNLSAKYYMTSDWIYLYFKPAQGPVSLTISANDSEGMMLTETDKFPEIATTVPLAK